MLKFRKTTEVLEEAETDVTTTEEAEKKVPEEDSEEEKKNQIEETEADFLLINLKEEIVLAEAIEVQKETLREVILREEALREEEILPDVLHLQEEVVLTNRQDVLQDKNK